jgi:hypothetical protein
MAKYGIHRIDMPATPIPRLPSDPQARTGARMKAGVNAQLLR